MSLRVIWFWLSFEMGQRALGGRDHLSALQLSHSCHLHPRQLLSNCPATYYTLFSLPCTCTQIKHTQTNSKSTRDWKMLLFLGNNHIFFSLLFIYFFFRNCWLLKLPFSPLSRRVSENFSDSQRSSCVALVVVSISARLLCGNMLAWSTYPTSRKALKPSHGNCVSYGPKK